MNTEKTIFEKIVSGEIPSSKIYEDDNFYAFLDIKPKSLGHALVIPKKPFKNLLEIDDKTLEEYLKIIQKVAKATKIGLKADGFNIIMNNEPAAGQEVFHAHTHIIPRFNNDNLDLNPGTHKDYSGVKEIEEYKNKIISNL